MRGKTGKGSKLLSVKRKPGSKDKHSYEPKPKKTATTDDARDSDKKDKKDKKNKKFKKSSASKRLKGT